MKLVGKYADEYLATGDAKVDAAGSMGGLVGFFTGGLWLPKQGVQKPPRLFLEFQPAGAGVEKSGALIGAMVQSGGGDILFLPFGSETKFLASIELVDK